MCRLSSAPTWGQRGSSGVIPSADRTPSVPAPGHSRARLLGASCALPIMPSHDAAKGGPKAPPSSAASGTSSVHVFGPAHGSADAKVSLSSWRVASLMRLRDCAVSFGQKMVIDATLLGASQGTPGGAHLEGAFAAAVAVSRGATRATLDGDAHSGQSASGMRRTAL